MDTLSSSVSTLLVPSQARLELPHFKTNNTTPTFHNNLLSYPKPTNNNSKSSSISNNKPTTSLIAPQSSLRTPNPENKVVFNRDPATGYAVALIESAQRHGSLERVAGDAERLLSRLGHEKAGLSLGDYLSEKRGFDRRLVRLVNMLVGNGDLGLVKRMLEEFARVYDEMLGTQLVLISSPEKMSEDRIFGIARTVQRLTGALRVKVKKFVGENYSFSSV